MSSASTISQARQVQFSTKARSSTSDVYWRAATLDEDSVGGGGGGQKRSRPVVVDMPACKVHSAKEASDGKISLLIRAPKPFVALIGEIEEHCIAHLRLLKADKQTDVVSVVGASDDADVDDFFKSRIVPMVNHVKSTNLVRVDLIASSLKVDDIVNAPSVSGVLIVQGAYTLHGKKAFGLAIDVSELEVHDDERFVFDGDDDDEDDVPVANDDAANEYAEPDPDDIENVQKGIRADLLRIADSYQERMRRLEIIGSKLPTSSTVGELDRIREEIELFAI